MPAFEYAIPDERTLVQTIMSQRVETWQSTITDLLRMTGSSRRRTGPSGSDRQQFIQESARDARSITKTWMRDLESAINQIWDANPGLSRQEFIDELTAWSDRRAIWKDLQITNMNQASARTLAQKRFRQENKVTGATFRFAGPPAKESECRALERAGLVDAKFVEAHETPIHINCPHFWEEQKFKTNVPALWTGG